MSRAKIAALLIAIVPAGACRSHGHDGPQADEYIVDCESAPDGGASASDENFASFVNKEAAGAVTKDDAKSPHLGAPAATVPLSKTAPPMFVITVPPVGAARVGDLRYLAACPIGRREAGPWQRLRELVALEGTAQAHCGAFTGVNYLFRLNRAGETAAVYTAVLSVDSFKPDAAIWSKAMQGRAGQVLTLTLERAVFLMGEITDGPFAPTETITLTVEP
jgi:hypothetical protein